jgi:hypothetical protein
MEDEGEKGLLGFPDIVINAIAGFCGQTGYITLMSTSSAARGTLGARV